MSSNNSIITDIELIKSYVRTKLIDTLTQATSVKGEEPDVAASEIKPKGGLGVSANQRHRKLRKADLELFSKTQTLSSNSFLQSTL